VAPELPGEVLEATETELADLALTRSPAALAQAATAIQALLDPDGTAPDDSPPPPNELHYRRRRDGSLTGRFTYRDPAAAETLHTALTVATPPPEQIAEPTQGQRAGVEPRGYSADAEAARTLPARRAHGLLDLAGEALTRGLNVPDPQPDQHDWGAHTAYEGMFPDPDQHHDTDNDEDSDQGSDQGSNTEGGAPADAGPPADPAGPAADAHDAGHAADAHDAGHADNSDRQDADDADNRDLSDHQDADAPDADAPDADEADRASSTGGSPAAGPPPTDSPPAGPSPTDPAPTDPATADPPAQPPWTRADVEGGERVALTVTLNYQTLRRTLANLPDPTPDPTRGAGDGHTGRLALLGENTWIRPETARRLACDAEIIPLVLGTRGEPLDLGRKHRLVPTALRRAVIARDRHCAHPGCRRRARRCQVHHIQHWADHGDTSLANCVLLCTYHHSLVHHSAWQIHMIDGLPWFTPPAYIDPQRTPRHNRPWQATTDAV
jgi:hypothetical protein